MFAFLMVLNREYRGSINRQGIEVRVSTRHDRELPPNTVRQINGKEYLYTPSMQYKSFWTPDGTIYLIAGSEIAHAVQQITSGARYAYVCFMKSRATHTAVPMREYLRNRWFDLITGKPHPFCCPWEGCTVRFQQKRSLNKHLKKHTENT